MNLAVSDCLMCLISLSFNITPRVTLCPIFYFFVYWIGSASFVSITSISIDRFFMVVCPIKHRILMKDKFMILWIAGIWIMNCVIPLFQMLWDGGETIGRQALLTVSVIVIILSAVMYSSIYYKLKRQPRNVALQNSTETRAQEIRILKEKRFLKTIIIIACAAFVSTLPYLVIDLLNGYLHFNNVFAILYTVSVSIFYINFAVNPLIYILCLPSYRKTFYLLYCRRGTAQFSWDQRLVKKSPEILNQTCKTNNSLYIIASVKMTVKNKRYYDKAFNLLSPILINKTNFIIDYI